ncbi:hypothetical protein GLOTRDRAFT_45987, partial [Gloeophyllum trabeum ATCC 11539]
GQCSTGTQQCCDNVTTADDPDAAALISLLGITIADPTTPLGLGCTALPAVGCQDSTPVCCENNNYNGLVNIGCVAINV